MITLRLATNLLVTANMLVDSVQSWVRTDTHLCLLISVTVSLPAFLADPCDTIDCGDQGTCTEGACACNVGYIGSRCQLSVAECTTTSACCGSFPDFASIHTMADYLAWGQNMYDTLSGDASQTCGSLLGMGLTCDTHFAPGREYAGFCDFSWYARFPLRISKSIHCTQ